jgi:hypothetical protein
LSINDAVLDGGRRGDAGGARVDPHARTRVLECAPVRGLSALAEHLVHVLVRHLVLEDLDDRAPPLLEHHRARDLDRPRGLHPASEVRVSRDELERRHLEPALEVRLVDLPPRGAQLTDEGGFERGGELARVGS